MIKSKRELAFFIQADRIMNGFPEKRSILTYMKEFFHPQRDILRFLKLMRKCDYYANGSKNTLLFLFYKIKYSRTSQRLGFSIDYLLLVMVWLSRIMELLLLAAQIK